MGAGKKRKKEEGGGECEVAGGQWVLDICRFQNLQDIVAIAAKATYIYSSEFVINAIARIINSGASMRLILDERKRGQ